MVVKHLKLANTSETLKSLSIFSLISDSVEEQTDFPCFLVSLQLCSSLGLVHIEVAFGSRLI